MPIVVFVSMPFGEDPKSPQNEWTKLYLYGLKPLEEKIDGLPEGVRHVPVTLWRADDPRNMGSLILKTNVIKGLEYCTFVLCVLTTAVVEGRPGLRLTNPNVLWELGYAEAIGKPIVVLADTDDLIRLPILAGMPNVCIYDHELVQRVKPHDAPDVLKHIARNLVPYLAKAEEEARRGPRGVEGARARFYPHREAINLPGLISEAETQVDILTTNLDYFLKRKFALEPHPIARALERGATVRVVTMDPESVIAEYRARQLVRGQDVPGYRRELRQGIVELYKRFGNNPDFHLHIYNDLPVQITTRVDNEIITSVVTIGEKARKRIQIHFNLNSEGVTESFVAHFQSMFDKSDDVAGMNWVLHPGVEDSMVAKHAGAPAAAKQTAPANKSAGRRARSHA